MVATRSNPPPSRTTRTSGNNSAVTTNTQSASKTKSKKTKPQSRISTGHAQTSVSSQSAREEPNPNMEDEIDSRNDVQREDSGPGVENGVKNVFKSRFPGLELDNFESQVDKRTVVELRQDIAKQSSKASRASHEIQSLVKGIRLDYEKRMLMAALMGGVPEVVIWNLV